ncbi:glutamate 5-kinase [Candidatus Marinamargulisbacteria bacterium SCGC AAA071-K20]|nr:glutamate 5-kinase [Candidatus Marinamargulisbacteria bacterium SCGC AAA071-K20]
MKNKIVIKIGTRILTTDSGQLDKNNLKNLVDQISTLQKTYRGDEYRFIIVTSGSITCGSEALGITPNTIPEKQAAASVGQYLLMQEYGKCFKENGINVGQILLTRDGIEDEARAENIKNTMNTLLNQGAIPIINENDSVATDEIKFGDNDELSSKVSALIKASKLILLTDTDGLYEKNPMIDTDAKFLRTVKLITDDIIRMANGPVNKRSRGGMKSKIEAAKFATSNGIETIIANGREKKIIEKLINNESFGTLFLVNQKEGLK